MAILQYIYKKALKILHQHGADIHMVSQNGGDALYTAAKNAHIDCVKFLVEIGLPFDNVNDKSGCTPLGIAAYSGYLNVVKYLQYKGASLTKSDDKGENTPLLLCAKAGQIEILEYLISFEEVRKYKYKFDNSAMVYSISSKNEKLVSILLASKQDVGVKNERGESILTHAIKTSSPNIIKILYSTHKYLDYENNDGITSFMQAFLDHNFEVVDIMRDLGANIHVQNSKGERIIDIAKARNDDVIIDYLKHYNLYHGNIDNNFNDNIMIAELRNLCTADDSEDAFFKCLKDTPELAMGSYDAHLYAHAQQPKVETQKEDNDINIINDIASKNINAKNDCHPFPSSSSILPVSSSSDENK